MKYKTCFFQVLPLYSTYPIFRGERVTVQVRSRRCDVIRWAWPENSGKTLTCSPLSTRGTREGCRRPKTPKPPASHAQTSCRRYTRPPPRQKTTWHRAELTDDSPGYATLAEEEAARRRGRSPSLSGLACGQWRSLCVCFYGRPNSKYTSTDRRGNRSHAYGVPGVHDFLLAGANAATFGCVLGLSLRHFVPHPFQNKAWGGGVDKKPFHFKHDN